MPYSGEGVQALVCALDDMKNATVIYAAESIRRVLKCLAYYEEFRSALSYCNKGFDYRSEKERACGQINGDIVFMLPKAKKSLVALVANLLMEFDRDSTYVVNFCDEYFRAENKQTSYDFFCGSVMTPFKLALVDLVVNGIEEDPKVVERTVDFAPSGLQQQTEYLIVNIYDAVSALASEQREPLSVMVEGFAAALDARDSLMIRAVWYGLKGALDSAKICKKEIAQIDETLRLYLLSDI